MCSDLAEPPRDPVPGRSSQDEPGTARWDVSRIRDSLEPRLWGLFEIWGLMGVVFEGQGLCIWSSIQEDTLGG